jgi:hypothetical protein
MPPDSVSLSSWLPVQAGLQEWQRLTRQLRLLNATLELEVDLMPARRHGSVLWGANVCGTMVGLAWGWREVRPNVVALDDPMSVSSNVILFDDEGAQLAGYRRILHLNRAVYSLHWQRHVFRRSATNAQATLAA